MSRDEFKPGEYRRQVILGTEATYRVTARVGDLVELEVVVVPGLPVGDRHRFTAAAVRSMRLLTPAQVADLERRTRD